MFTKQNSHTWLLLISIYGAEEHGNLWFKFLYSYFHKYPYQIYRIMQKLRKASSMCENTFIISKNGFWQRIILYKINAIIYDL